MSHEHLLNLTKDIKHIHDIQMPSTLCTEDVGHTTGSDSMGAKPAESIETLRVNTDINCCC